LDGFNDFAVPCRGHYVALLMQSLVTAVFFISITKMIVQQDAYSTYYLKHQSGNGLNNAIDSGHRFSKFSDM
jgi:hypothetical protein